MPSYRVTLFVESAGSADDDPSFTTELEANEDSEALSFAKASLAQQFPDFNFGKTWCWHVEKCA
jgi:hypothetical protein